MTTPLFLSNHTGQSGKKFACSMQSVVLDTEMKTAVLVQQPAFSTAGERTAATSSWVMPMWTYDYSFLQSKDPASGPMVTMAIKVGDELRIGDNDVNFVNARVEEIVTVDSLRNDTGTTVLLASGYRVTLPTLANNVQDTAPMIPRYLLPGELVDLNQSGLVTRHGIHGESAIATNSVDRWNPYTEASCARLCFRLSQPVNLNTYIPSIQMIKDGVSKDVYTLDNFGVATTLKNWPYTAYPFASLVSRNAATRTSNSFTEYHEKFYWPAYVIRSTTTPTMTLKLENTRYAPSRITLMKYTVHGAQSNEVLVMHVAGVYGEVKSNNVHANGSFAVLPIAESTNGDAYADRKLASSAGCGYIATAGIISMQRSVEVRFTDLSGAVVDNLSISLWFSVS